MASDRMASDRASSTDAAQPRRQYTTAAAGPRIDPLRLPEDFRIGSVRAQHDALLAAFAASGEIGIDAAAVESIDMAGLQLLASALKSAESRNRPLRLVAMSQPLRDAFARAGLQPPSPLPENLQA